MNVQARLLAEIVAPYRQPHFVLTIGAFIDPDLCVDTTG
jgi:hypothetical protein